MIGTRGIVRTAGLGLLVFGALLLAWPWLGRPYAALFRTQASVLFGVESTAHRIDVREIREPGREEDTEIRVVVRGAPGYTRVALRSRFIGYFPTSLFLALLASASIQKGWKGRRLGAFVKGLIAVDAFVLARTGLLVLEAWFRHGPGCPQPHGGGSSSTAWTHLLDTSLAIFVLDPSMYVLVPLLIVVFLVAQRGRDAYRGLAPGAPQPGVD
jgi:hypothetical protein